jgi:hypothetical protein
MVSLLHAGVIKLVRDDPEFAAALLDQVLDVKVPRFREAGLVDAELDELAPVEYRADAKGGATSLDAQRGATTPHRRVPLCQRD